jgi:SAM-dependent methyltransferase
MAKVQQHYDALLSDVYSWMLGGFAAGVGRNAAFFEEHGIRPTGSRVAVDLGAGCGFQSIPLAQLGFSVVAIDLDEKLLAELASHVSDEAIVTVRDDLMNFRRHVSGPIELAVCMQDTLLHLPSADDVSRLFQDVFDALDDGGKFVITYRDLSGELSELDRFIPVRSDDRLLLTCFLEYEPETVKVHDLLYRRDPLGWTFHKSYYRKLRLAPEWVDDELERAGFTQVHSQADKGFVTVVAAKTK